MKILTQRMNLVKNQNFLMTLLLCTSMIAFKYTTTLKMMKSSKVIVVYCVLTTCLMQGWLWYITLRNFESSGNYIDPGSEVTKLILIMESLSLQIGFIFICYAEIFKLNEQLQFVNNLISIEEKLKSLAPDAIKDEVYTKMKRISLAIISSLLLYFSIVFILYSLIIILDGGESPTALLTLGSQLFSKMQYNFLGIFMLMLIQIIHQMLKSFTKRLNEVVGNLRPRTNLIPLLKIHNELHLTIKSFNESFGLTVFGIFLYCSGILTCEIYFGFILFECVHKSFLVWNGVLNIVWVTPLLIFMSLIGRYCEKTKQEANKINGIFKAVVKVCRNGTVIK